MWFGVEMLKVKVTGSISVFFTLFTITHMHIWLRTAIRRGFELYECHLVFVSDCTFAVMLPEWNKRPIRSSTVCGRCLCVFRRADQARSTSRNEGIRARSVSVVGGAWDWRKQLHPRLQSRLVQTRSPYTCHFHAPWLFTLYDFCCFRCVTHCILHIAINFLYKLHFYIYQINKYTYINEDCFCFSCFCRYVLVYDLTR